MKKYLILSLALAISMVGLQSCDSTPPNGKPLPPHSPSSPQPQVPLNQDGSPAAPLPPPPR